MPSKWRRLRCLFSGHILRTFDHPKYPIYKIRCVRCGWVQWDGGFDDE